MTRPARPAGPAAQIPASLARHMASAVDLSTLRPAGPAADGQTSAPAAAATGPVPAVFDVTEATFQAEVLDRSMQVPVLIDFWADWCGPCKQLSPVLEKLAAEAAGTWVLAKIDVDANQRLAQAFQVQSIPSVFAVVAGQLLPLFQGALPEAQIKPVLDEVVRVAAENGVTGVAVVVDGEAPPVATVVDPVLQTAQEAIERGDVEAALASYRELVARNPADDESKSAVARCELLVRTRGVDEAAVRAAAHAAPDDIDAALQVADVDMVRGRVDEAFGRLTGLVRSSSGDDRQRVREHLVGLFGVLDPDDPRLGQARRDLANALF